MIQTPGTSGQPERPEKVKAERFKTVWRLSSSGDPEGIGVQPGISDGSSTELLTTELQEGDAVIVGIDSGATGRRADALPPGFGSGQRRPGSRDRGI